MLDVHPPHHPTHTWKDFFIHIATITVGLLIAVGLEQTVERLHQRYQLRETREALQREREANRHHVDRNMRNWLATQAALKTDLAVFDAIRQHPSLPRGELPGVLRYGNSPFLYDHAVWDAAVRDGMVRLMPLEEANADQEFYQLAEIMLGQSLTEWDALLDADRYLLVDGDPTHLSMDERAETVRLTHIAYEKHIQFGYSYGRLASEFPDFPQTMTWHTMASLLPPTDTPALAAARRRSDESIRALVNQFAGPAAADSH